MNAQYNKALVLNVLELPPARSPHAESYFVGSRSDKRNSALGGTDAIYGRRKTDCPVT